MRVVSLHVLHAFLTPSSVNQVIFVKKDDETADAIDPNILLELNAIEEKASHPRVLEFEEITIAGTGNDGERLGRHFHLRGRLLAHRRDAPMRRADGTVRFIKRNEWIMIALAITGTMRRRASTRWTRA